MLLWFSALILFLSSIPYLAGFLAQTPDLRFSGAIFNRPDYAVYLGSMHAGWRGEWLYRFGFTTEAGNTGAFTKLFYLLLGHIARWTDLPVEVIFHLARIAAGAFCCYALYALIRRIFPSILEQRLAFTLALMGGGLGWVQYALGQLTPDFPLPIDFWLVDGFPYMGFLFYPHFAVVTGIMAWMFAGFLDYLHLRKLWMIVAIGALGVVMQLIQPYAVFLIDLALLGATVAVGLAQRRLFWPLFAAVACIGLAQAPLLAYNAFIFLGDSVWAQYRANNIASTPPWYYLAWGYALLWPAALLAVPRLWRELRRADPESSALVWRAGLGGMLAWFCGGLLVIYAPVSFQRRLLHAYSLPLAALAVYGWSQALKPWLEGRGIAARATRFSAGAVWGLAVLTPMLLMMGHAFFLSVHPGLFFDPAELAAAVEWLGEHASGGGAVLASEQTALLVAEKTGLTVYYGHRLETIDFARKEREAQAFFKGELSEAWARGAGIEWVIAGPYERPWAADLPLPQVYQNGATRIYRVSHRETE